MISIICLVWNRSDLTHQFLLSLRSLPPEVEVIIINNASTDNTQQVLSKLYWSGLRVIHNEENKGFGPANNQGAGIARGNVLIFLSNDVIVRGEFIKRITRELYTSPDILGGAQLFSHNTGWNTFTTLARWDLYTQQGKGYADLVKEQETIPYLAGWCLFCTKPTWQKLGGFDERYLICDYEDIDLSYTAIRKGIELREIKLPLEHISGQSAEKLEGGRLAITLANQVRFKEKWGFK